MNVLSCGGVYRRITLAISACALVYLFGGQPIGFREYQVEFWSYGPYDTRWYKNERLPKSDDFRQSAVGTTLFSKLIKASKLSRGAVEWSECKTLISNLVMQPVDPSIYHWKTINQHRTSLFYVFHHQLVWAQTVQIHVERKNCETNRGIVTYFLNNLLRFDGKNYGVLEHKSNRNHQFSSNTLGSYQEYPFTVGGMLDSPHTGSGSMTHGLLVPPVCLPYDPRPERSLL